MRRVAYFLAINLALLLARVQFLAAEEIRDCAGNPYLIPWAMLSFAVYVIFRPPAILATRTALRLATGIPVEERARLRP